MARLDLKLLEKLATKLNKSVSYIRQQISKRATRKSVTSEAELISWARSERIGSSNYLRKQPAHIQEQARSHSAFSEANSSVGTRQARTPKPRKEKRRRGNTVFVVHGRNSKIRSAMFSFLKSLGLVPLEWTEIIRKSKQGSPYVGTLLEKAFSDAAAIVVLITPDDVAKLKKEFHGSREEHFEKNLTGQARPNVLFEAGMAFGRDSNSTILVQFGFVRPFSDVIGRHVVKMDNSHEKRKELAVKISNAGCTVNTNGTQWKTEGDFSL